MTSFLHALFLLWLPGISFLPCNPYAVTLQTPAGKSYPLQQHRSSKAVVLIFLLPDCPACQSYSPVLNALHSTYGKKSVSFVGVVPGNYATQAEISDFVRQYKVTFPVVADSANRLVRCLGATIVPETFVVDEKGVTRYAGRIDDWMTAPGKKRQVITAHDLENAITAVLQDKEVKVKKTKAVGCFIE